jgi:thiol-disulfide isomerase/thioredoxin
MRKSIKSRQILSFGLYILLAVLIAYLVNQYYTPVLSEGTKAPFNQKIRLLSGEILWPKKLYKPVIVNFWANFCATCQKELPILFNLANKYYGRVNFYFLATATDIDAIMAIKQQYKADFNFALIDDVVLQAWQAFVLPTTYVIDQQGIIAYAKTGLVSEVELTAVIESILKK